MRVVSEKERKENARKAREKYWEKVKSNPEYNSEFFQKRREKLKQQNDEIRETLNTNKKIHKNTKEVISLKQCYITCKTQCCKPTEFMKCKECKEYALFLRNINDYRNSRNTLRLTHNELV